MLFLSLSISKYRQQFIGELQHVKFDETHRMMALSENQQRCIMGYFVLPLLTNNNKRTRLVMKPLHGSSYLLITVIFNLHVLSQ